MTDRSIPDAGRLTGWRKSTYSDNMGGSCLEVLDDHAPGLPVRDSKDPHGPAPIFGPAAWSEFVTAVKADTLR